MSLKLETGVKDGSLNLYSKSKFFKMTFNLNLILGVIVATVGVILAITESEKNALSKAAKPILAACEKEFGVTFEQVLAAKKMGNIDTLDPCFIACFFKKIGVINSDGMYDLDTAISHTNEFIKSDESKKIIDSATTCGSVNDQEVSDGSKGCERAKLLISCLMKEHADLSPFTA